MTRETKLQGWKAIAFYLGREERTAMRWADRGMPVHRVAGRGHGSVHAFSHEIDAWLSNDRSSATKVEVLPEAETVEGKSAVASKPRRKLVATGITTIMILIIVCGFVIGQRRGGTITRPASVFVDPAAKAAYLQATYDWNLRTRDSLQRAIREYGDAISRDPRNADSYVGLANSYLLIREYGSLSDSEAYTRAEAAARAALQLAPEDAAMHRALAFIAFWWHRDRGTARVEFARALALQPNDPLTHHWFATALSADGEPEVALREIKKARELDPASTSILSDEGLITYLAGSRNEGLTILRNLEGEQPQDASVHRALASIALYEGRADDYLQEATYTAKLDGSGQALETQRHLTLEMRRGGARAMLTEMVDEARRDVGRTASGQYRVAQLASLAGQRADALAALARACAVREPATIGAPSDLWLSRTLTEAQIARTCGSGTIS